jgi:hypothetical protein
MLRRGNSKEILSSKMESYGTLVAICKNGRCKPKVPQMGSNPITSSKFLGFKETRQTLQAVDLTSEMTFAGANMDGMKNRRVFKAMIAECHVI